MEIKIQLKHEQPAANQKAQKIPYHLQELVEKNDRVTSTGHLEQNVRKNCFANPVLITVKMLNK